MLCAGPPFEGLAMCTLIPKSAPYSLSLHAPLPVQVDVHTSFDGTKLVGRYIALLSPLPRTEPVYAAAVILFSLAPYLQPIPPYPAADSTGFIWTHVVGQPWNAETYAGDREWTFVTTDENGDVLGGM